MKGTWIAYSSDELAWIEANKSRIRTEAHAEFCSNFGRNDITLINYAALCKRNGWLTGRTGRIEPGAIPPNKGVRCPEGKGGRHPNARKTQFKKGGLPHNTNYLGHERVSKDGYVEISIDETNPHTGFERRYVLKHRHLWESENGPVPDGMFLKCLDTNRQNTDPSNWELLPRAAQVYIGARFGIDYEAAEPEVRPAIIAVAKLKHAAKTAKAKVERA